MQIGKKTITTLLLGISMLIITLSGCTGGTVMRGWSGVIEGKGNLYFGGMNGKVYAVKPENGTTIWATELEPLPEGGWFSPSSYAAIYSTPAFEDDMVFAGSYMMTGSQERGRLFGLNAATGTVVWTYPARETLNANIIGGITVANGIVYAGASDHKVYALDAATGNLKWNEPFITDGPVWARPVVDGGTVFIGSMDKNLYALDAINGTEKWRFTTDGAIVSSVLVNNGTVYFGCYNRKFYAVNAADGKLNEKWQKPMDADRGFWASPVRAGNAIFIPSLDGKVYIIDASTDMDLGSIKLADSLSSTAAVVGDSIVQATPEGSLYLLDEKNYNAPAFIDLKSKVLANLTSVDGTIYVHTWEPERLYALDSAGKQKWNPLDVRGK